MGITHSHLDALGDDPADKAAGKVVGSDWNADHAILPVSEPASPASGWTIYCDTADGGLKAKSSTGSVILLASGNDPLAIAFFAAVATAGGTISTARKVLYNNLFAAIRAAGAVPYTCSLPILAAENATTALVDLFTLHTMTPVNAPTFTANQGYAGNGTNSYINTNYTAASPYSTNVATIGCYTLTNRTTGQAFANFGADALDAGGPTTQMFPVYTDGKAYTYVNGSVFGGVPASPNAQGSWMVVRTGASATSLRRNQVQIAAENDAAIGSPVHNFFIGACPDNTGTPTNFSTDQNAAAVVGAFPTIVMADAVAAAINAYMTAVGANVY